MGAAAKKLNKKLPESTAVRGTVHFISDNGRVSQRPGASLREQEAPSRSLKLRDWEASLSGQARSTVGGSLPIVERLGHRSQ